MASEDFDRGDRQSASSEKRIKHARVTVTICDGCNRPSRKGWRCEWCGKDLAGSTTTEGRMS
ncbi:hypothetical protein [Halobacterium sp. CBA1126]|uniref:hypothetical protein n=1 Tax=Halobacterium sp. CBA1126 TaxID=2668074 RepID=UPI0012FC0E9F|nr:hypothetical protein [Halobacterium sp. CBA1126]MUV59808.1 hypothetical protein [Halobacterium sp. CBA1126]